MSIIKRKMPKCPGCDDNGYVTRNPKKKGLLQELWCGRCGYWFGGNK